MTKNSKSIKSFQERFNNPTALSKEMLNHSDKQTEDNKKIEAFKKVNEAIIAISGDEDAAKKKATNYDFMLVKDPKNKDNYIILIRKKGTNAYFPFTINEKTTCHDSTGKDIPVASFGVHEGGAKYNTHLSKENIKKNSEFVHDVLQAMQKNKDKDSVIADLLKKYKKNKTEQEITNIYDHINNQQKNGQVLPDSYNYLKVIDKKYLINFDHSYLIGSGLNNWMITKLANNKGIGEAIQKYNNGELQLIANDAFIKMTGTEELYNRTLLAYYKGLLKNEDDIEAIKKKFEESEKEIKGDEDEKKKIKERFKEAFDEAKKNAKSKEKLKKKKKKIEEYKKKINETADINDLNNIKKDVNDDNDLDENDKEELDEQIKSEKFNKYKNKIQKTTDINGLNDIEKDVNDDNDLDEKDKEGLRGLIKGRKKLFYQQDIEGAKDNNELEKIRTNINDDNDLDENNKKELEKQIKERQKKLNKMKEIVDSIKDKPNKIIDKIPDIEKGVNDGTINALQIFDLYQTINKSYQEAKDNSDDKKKYFTILWVLKSLQVKIKLSKLHSLLENGRNVSIDDFQVSNCTENKKTQQAKQVEIFNYIKKELDTLSNIDINAIDIQTIKDIRYNGNTDKNQNVFNNFKKKITSNMQTKSGKHFKIENFSQNIPGYAVYCQIMDGVQGFNNSLSQKIEERTNILREIENTENIKDLKLIENPFLMPQNNDGKHTNIEIENDPSLNYTQYIQNKLEAYALSTCFGTEIGNKMQAANNAYEHAKQKLNVNKTKNSGCCGVPEVIGESQKITNPLDDDVFVKSFKKYGENCVKKDIEDFARNMNYFIKLKFMIIMIEFIEQYQQNQKIGITEDNLLKTTMEKINDKYGVEEGPWEFTQCDTKLEKYKQKYKNDKIVSDLIIATENKLKQDEKDKHLEFSRPIEILREYMEDFGKDNDASKTLNKLVNDLGKDDFKKFVRDEQLLVENSKTTLYQQIKNENFKLDTLKKSINEALNAQVKKIVPGSVAKLKTHNHIMHMLYIITYNNGKNPAENYNKMCNLNDTSWLFINSELFPENSYGKEALKLIDNAFNFNNINKKIQMNKILKSYACYNVIFHYKQEKEKDQSIEIKNPEKFAKNTLADLTYPNVESACKYEGLTQWLLDDKLGDCQSREFAMAGFSSMLTDITKREEYNDLLNLACLNNHYTASLFRNRTYKFGNVLNNVMVEQLLTLKNDGNHTFIEEEISKKKLADIVGGDTNDKRAVNEITNKAKQTIKRINQIKLIDKDNAKYDKNKENINNGTSEYGNRKEGNGLGY